MWLMQFLLKFNADFIGADSYGNRYYQQKPIFAKVGKQLRRRIIYHASAEASKVPAEWYGWLHHTHALPLSTPAHAWQKPHEMNLSGTPKAYHPANSLYKNFKSKVPQRYQAWQPDDDENNF